MQKKITQFPPLPPQNNRMQIENSSEVNLCAFNIDEKGEYRINEVPAIMQQTETHPSLRVMAGETVRQNQILFFVFPPKNWRIDGAVQNYYIWLTFELSYRKQVPVGK